MRAAIAAGATDDRAKVYEQPKSRREQTFQRWALSRAFTRAPFASSIGRNISCSAGNADDWREAVKRILLDDWRFQFNEWNQSPWACVWRPGLVSQEEAMAWRAEAWQGHEDIEPERTDDD